MPPRKKPATAELFGEVEPVGAKQGVLHRELTVIEVADSADLTGLLADSRLGQLVLARIGPTAAVVDPRDQHKLLQALKKAGHTSTVNEQQ